MEFGYKTSAAWDIGYIIVFGNRASAAWHFGQVMVFGYRTSAEWDLEGRFNSVAGMVTRLPSFRFHYVGLCEKLWLLDSDTISTKMKEKIKQAFAAVYTETLEKALELNILNLINL